MENSGTLKIEDLLLRVKEEATKTISQEEYLLYLDVLEQYECWDGWFKLVKNHALKNPQCFIEDMSRSARIHSIYFEDMNAAAESCRLIVESSGVKFSEFRLNILSNILDADDFAAEGAILQKVWERFSILEDRIEALERICFIYEKKVHNERILNSYYERLLKTHPENQKALRHFRTLNTQMQDWPAVVDILTRLLNSARHPQEGFRHAQELAAVHLYHLDEPQTAVKIIEENCQNSTLDTSTIHYEAYYRLGKPEGCLKVLRNCLASIEEPSTRAIIHYRIGSILEKNNEIKLAAENYEKTLKLDETFLEAIEGLISTNIKMRQWSAVKDWLSVLASRVTSASLASQVRAGLSRLEEGLKIESPT